MHYTEISLEIFRSAQYDNDFQRNLVYRVRSMLNSSGTMTMTPLLTTQCPIPINEYPTVTLAHGGGGRLTQMLIERMVLPAFANPALEPLHDGALLEIGGARLAFSTDSFVIDPLFFPGGDIGALAVHGTVNDLAMCGATPIGLSAGLILEEG